MNKDLNSALEKLKDKYSSETVMKLEPQPQRNTQSLSTGVLTLDLATGMRGLPKPGITEIFGRAGSGKSTLAMHLLKNAQENGLAAYIDAEHTFDPEYAKKIGVDLDNLLICQPTHGEQAFEIIRDLAQMNIELIVVDSVSALVPIEDMAPGSDNLGSHSTMMKKGLQDLTYVFDEPATGSRCYETSIVFINQLRDKTSTFGRQVRTTGGAALKFYASMRIGLRHDGYLEDGDTHFGVKIQARIVKNKFAVPYQEAQLKLFFDDKGISHAASVLDAALQRGVVTQSGSWIKYENCDLILNVHGWRAAVRQLQESFSLENDIETELLYGGKT